MRIRKLLLTLFILSLSTPAFAGLEDSSGQVHGNATAVGNAAVTSTQKKFGAGSLGLDGVGDYIYYADHADWNFGTGNFTIELWVRFNVITGTQSFWAQWNTADDNEVFRIIVSDKRIQLYALNAGAGVATYDMSADWPSMAVDTWYHVEVVRSTTSVYVFIDGVSQSLTTSIAISNNAMPNSNGVGAIGTMVYHGSTLYYPVNGYIDELRISNVARHTSNFTPETGEFSSDANTLLLMHLNTDAVRRIIITE